MLKILIADDHTIVREGLKQILSEMPDMVITDEAKNGQEGLETALCEHPDLILLDIIMPVMDGITMLFKPREDEWGKS